MKQKATILLLLILLLLRITLIGYVVNADHRNSFQDNSTAIAVIDSRKFQTAINEYKLIIDKLDGEFKARLEELNSLKEKKDKWLYGIEHGVGVPDYPPAYQQFVEQLQVVTKEYDRKKEDFDSDYNIRKEKLTAPIRSKIISYIENYRVKHKISLIIDIANFKENEIFYNPNIDITDDFINDFNSLNLKTK
jgi:Skp family chaperone for outer membrane proteins